MKPWTFSKIEAGLASARATEKTVLGVMCGSFAIGYETEHRNSAQRLWRHSARIPGDEELAFRCSRREFVEFAQTLVHATGDEIQALFGILDESGNGNAERQDLLRFFTCRREAEDAIDRSEGRCASEGVKKPAHASEIFE